MKRVCTEAENQILGASLRDTTLVEKNSFNLIPGLLGLFLGLGVGAGVAFAIGSESKAAIEVVLVISMIVMSNVCIFVWNGAAERIAQTKKSRRTFDGRSFQINGGTVIKYLGSEEDAWLEFAEDDLLASDGSPYIIGMAVQHFPAVKAGDRIMLVYCDTGEYIPMPVGDHTQSMISPNPPDTWKNADKTTCISIPHPNAIDLDKEDYRMNEQEAAALAKKFGSRKRVKGGTVVGIVLSSVLVLFLFAIVWIVLIGTEVIESLQTAWIVAGVLLLLWGIATYGIARGISSAVAGSFKKLEYKKRVLFHSMTSSLENNTSMKELTVYEYIEGQLEQKTYSMNGNIVLPKDIKFGTVIYKYSNRTDDGKSNIVHFSI